ncbi:hypothetical protein H4Q26_007096 [Puccinia striiformis f. sp. tritici PST-130]|nr:hypothetical protein H4Q26_007096 [Puccinia striiformis f. sp. tritici PST-130]
MRNPIKPRQIQQLAKHSRSFSLISRRPNELQASLMVEAGLVARRTHSRITHYLRDEVAYGLVDRLRDIRRKYDQIVEFGSGHGSLVKPLLDFYLPRKIILTDSCRDLLWRDQEFDPSDVEISRVVMDEELVSLEPESQECIMSCLSLHWVNDYLIMTLTTGTLIQIQNSLKPDGVFIGAMFGGDTLFELRTSLQLAEQEREGGISARYPR